VEDILRQQVPVARQAQVWTTMDLTQVPVANYAVVQENLQAQALQVVQENLHTEALQVYQQQQNRQEEPPNTLYDIAYGVPGTLATINEQVAYPPRPITPPNPTEPNKKLFQPSFHKYKGKCVAPLHPEDAMDGLLDTYEILRNMAPLHYERGTRNIYSLEQVRRPKFKEFQPLQEATLSNTPQTLKAAVENQTNLTWHQINKPIRDILTTAINYVWGHGKKQGQEKKSYFYDIYRKRTKINTCRAVVQLAEWYTHLGWGEIPEGDRTLISVYIEMITSTGFDIKESIKNPKIRIDPKRKTENQIITEGATYLRYNDLLSHLVSTSHPRFGMHIAMLCDDDWSNYIKQIMLMQTFVTYEMKYEAMSTERRAHIENTTDMCITKLTFPQVYLFIEKSKKWNAQNMLGRVDDYLKKRQFQLATTEDIATILQREDAKTTIHEVYLRREGDNKIIEKLNEADWPWLKENIHKYVYDPPIYATSAIQPYQDTIIFQNDFGVLRNINNTTLDIKYIVETACNTKMEAIEPNLLTLAIIKAERWTLNEKNELGKQVEITAKRDRKSVV
jgi:hypothetical protein